ncbi:hypothetical protein [Mycobacterium sp.]|uniref:Rv1733c family protein n=1 Tax=Mycobacterium sp. TaxID=1785 RepID=UPI002CA46B8C|nr:hypothetical protein [Mycobacterium sp.]HTY32135.1 hypothetical protein [Mycobacterium sp.]
MQTFTIDPRRWRIGRIFGRNPLLRRADRIEAVVTVIALLASLIALPVACVVGAMAYGARAHFYAQEAHERHLVTATVADARRGDFGTTVVQASWPLAAGKRTATLQLSSPAEAGESIELWVDKDGKASSPPTPTWHAVGDAVGIAGAIALIAAVGIASLVAGVRWWLDRARDAQWDRDIRCLVDGGGRTNRQ